jgi:hypothetical protein
MARLIGVLFVVGFVLHYFWWIAAAAAAWFAYRSGRDAWARRRAAVDAWEAEQRAIAARADQQHAWTLAGDPRGTYGGAKTAVANAALHGLRTEPH